MNMEITSFIGRKEYSTGIRDPPERALASTPNRLLQAGRAASKQVDSGKARSLIDHLSDKEGAVLFAPYKSYSRYPNRMLRHLKRPLTEEAGRALVSFRKKKLRTDSKTGLMAFIGLFSGQIPQKE
ncbi:unnamed protein product [Dovyalis caffra]|uniref:Uncharacterized protein n=1 Tax=Dovyalis caffra TaxID=77055 RepID=A0AAV1QRN5_9ROSI|nr:unnamed protein product [Dovyalis caffra]